jgi:hypothetical protein
MPEQVPTIRTTKIPIKNPSLATSFFPLSPYRIYMYNKIYVLSST